MRHATHMQCMCACTHGCMCRVGPLTHTTISGRPSAAATDAADANARSRFPSPFFTLTITHLRESSCTGVGERGRERAFVERARAVKTRGRGSNLWAQRPRWGILLAASLEKLERLERVNRPGQLLHACRHGQGRSDYISPSSSRSMLSGHMLWA